MKKSSAFAPGHISGFFQVYDESDDPAKIGSRNCGPCITSGVLTEVKIDDNSSGIKVYVNDKETEHAKTTETAVKEILKIRGGVIDVEINHLIQAPIGSGYGLSGAGAIGAVLALSNIMDLRVSRGVISQIAHKSEIACKTGLGDVGPQMIGGLVMSLKPGSQPYGEWIKIETSRKLNVICGTWGPLPTPQILRDPGFRERSKELGEVAINSLINDLSMENFMSISQEFARGLNILDEEFEEVMNELSDVSSIGASAVMLGRAVFALVKETEVDKIYSEFEEYFEPESIMITPLDYQGARIIE